MSMRQRLRKWLSSTTSDWHTIGVAIDNAHAGWILVAQGDHADGYARDFQRLGVWYDDDGNVTRAELRTTQPRLVIDGCNDVATVLEWIAEGRSVDAIASDQPLS